MAGKDRVVIPQEAAQVLATFATTFQRTVDEQMMQLWFQSTLAQVDADVAWEVVDVIVREDERFPTPARFNALRRGVERRQEQPYQALAGPTPEPDWVKQLIADTRARYLNKPKGQR
jgi:hypothetical protein